MNRSILTGLVLSAVLLTPQLDARPRTQAQAEINLNDGQALNRAMTHLESRSAELGLKNVFEELSFRSMSRDPLGQVHIRMDQLIRGIPVFGAQVIVHMDHQGAFRGFTTDLTPVVGLPTLKPAISPFAALRTGMANFARGTSSHPDVSLGLFETRDGDLHLTYRVSMSDIESDDPKEHVYFISAQTNRIVFEHNNLHTRVAEGTGESLYLGEVPLTTNQDGSRYFMEDASRGGNYTTDMGNGTSGDGELFADSDNVWGTGNERDAASAAADAHFGSMATWDYLLESFGREGIADNGEGSLSRVHYSSNYNNAFWSDGCFCMTYGDGDGSILSPLVSLDVIAHEMTHGVTASTAGLNYFWEAGGMNEGFSDIMGTAVEFWVAERGVDSNPDYLIGEDIYTPDIEGDAMRYMDNPGQDGRSIDHASQMKFFTDPHYSSGLPNYVYFLASEGGTHVTSGDVVRNPMGPLQAAGAFYYGVANYMSPRSRFSAQKEATVRAAREMYGEAAATTMDAAWTACGVN